MLQMDPEKAERFMNDRHGEQVGASCRSVREERADRGPWNGRWRHDRNPLSPLTDFLVKGGFVGD